MYGDPVSESFPAVRSRPKETELKKGSSLISLAPPCLTASESVTFLAVLASKGIPGLQNIR
jgi:hypothetical protein